MYELNSAAPDKIFHRPYCLAVSHKGKHILCSVFQRLSKPSDFIFSVGSCGAYLIESFDRNNASLVVKFKLQREYRHTHLDLMDKKGVPNQVCTSYPQKAGR